jgi:competence protein ComEA
MNVEPQKSAQKSNAGGRAGDSTAPEARSFLWLKQADQWLLGVLLCAGTILLGVHWVRINGWVARGEPVQVLTADGYFYTLDVNHATWVEWAQLDGIGETLARRIVQDRLDRGPFADIEDVSRVRGIGQKTMDRIRPHLRNRNVFTVEARNRSEVENTP